MNQEDKLRGLMCTALNGDAADYRRLLLALSGHLRAYYKGRLVRAGRQVAEAEDIMQETLMAVHAQRHTYDPSKPLTPWVYAIARYKLVDYLRRTQSTLTEVPIENAGEIIAGDDRAAAESSHDLARLLARLPEKMRLAIKYVKIDGLSVTEAAAQCGISESAVKVNVHRGLKALTAFISRESKHEDG